MSEDKELEELKKLVIVETKEEKPEEQTMEEMVAEDLKRGCSSVDGEGNIYLEGIRDKVKIGKVDKSNEIISDTEYKKPEEKIVEEVKTKEDWDDKDFIIGKITASLDGCTISLQDWNKLICCDAGNLRVFRAGVINFKESKAVEKPISIPGLKYPILIKKESEDKRSNEDIEKERILKEYLMLISGREKKWNEATELLTNFIKDRYYIYTTKNDQKTEMWIYKNGIYTPNGKSEVKEILRSLLLSLYNAFIYNLVINKLEPDTFIDEDEFFKHNYISEVPIKEGILNIITREVHPFDPKKIFFNKLPISYNAEAKCPLIDDFLKGILSSEDDIKVFYELIGFCLLKEYKFEKAFMLVGGGRNGKDKALELIKRTIGIENCASIPLCSLIPDSFYLSEFFNKMANIAGDIGNQDLKDTSMFKALTGRSIVSGHRKFLRPIVFQNYAKFIFACNDLPMVYDLNKAFWDRWVLLEFPYTFVTQKEYDAALDKTNLKIRDEDIIEKITTPEELSGLLNKAIDGLHAILLARNFSTTKGSEDVKNLWIRKANSFMAFCMDNLEEDQEAYLTKKELRKYYSRYCKLHKIPTKSDFVIKRVIQDMFGASEDRKNVDGETIHIWIGVKWKVKKYDEL